MNKFYSSAEIESFANDLNKKYNPERLVKPLPVDVFDIIDITGARVAIEYLSPDRTYLGATTFDDGTVWIWPNNPYVSGMLPEKKFFHSGTIIIDADLDGSNNMQDNFRENFTVIHECFHYAKHAAVFKHQVHYSVIDAYYRQNNHNNILNIIERQADYAAALFLMPRQAVINGAKEFFNMKDSSEILHFGYANKEKIRKFGMLFGVNYSPMVYRMQEIGILDTQFDSTYV